MDAFTSDHVNAIYDRTLTGFGQMFRLNNTGAISTTGTGTTTIEAALGAVNDTAVLTVH